VQQVIDGTDVGIAQSCTCSGHLRGSLADHDLLFSDVYLKFISQIQDQVAGHDLGNGGDFQLLFLIVAEDVGDDTPVIV
jgi:hypothetical protein